MDPGTREAASELEFDRADLGAAAQALFDELQRLERVMNQGVFHRQVFDFQ
jgi:hypothetical protein